VQHAERELKAAAAAAVAQLRALDSQHGAQLSNLQLYDAMREAAHEADSLAADAKGRLRAYERFAQGEEDAAMASDVAEAEAAAVALRGAARGGTPTAARPQIGLPPTPSETAATERAHAPSPARKLALGVGPTFALGKTAAAVASGALGGLSRGLASVSRAAAGGSASPRSAGKGVLGSPPPRTPPPPQSDAASSGSVASSASTAAERGRGGGGGGALPAGLAGLAVEEALALLTAEAEARQQQADDRRAACLRQAVRMERSFTALMPYFVCRCGVGHKRKLLPSLPPSFLPAIPLAMP
jgi:hypothetical protein